MLLYNKNGNILQLRIILDTETEGAKKVKYYELGFAMIMNFEWNITRNNLTNRNNLRFLCRSIYQATRFI